MTLQLTPIEGTNLQEISSSPKPQSGKCPIDHTAFSKQKAALHPEALDLPALEVDAQGVWHVRSFDAVRAILRAEETRQAGFKAEMVNRMDRKMTPPVLFQDGEAHHHQRRMIARFFTPKTTNEKYRQMMEEFADGVLNELRTKKRADLSKLSMTMAVKVAAQVVGLTNSLLPGIDRRIDAFFAGGDMDFKWTPRAIFSLLRRQLTVLQFLYLDVSPAIKVRRKEAREDVISHLVTQGATTPEILTECITYGAAGMVTTREFICIAAWHMLENPELRNYYLNSSEEKRYNLLQETLRLEPVVGNLTRRATADITLDVDGRSMTIPAGALIDLHIGTANLDLSVVGEEPRAICPERLIHAEKTTPALLSFGDGAHRCPGAYIAIQESDIFLRKLLKIDGLRIERAPALSWGELTQGYEFRKFILTVEES